MDQTIMLERLKRLAVHYNGNEDIAAFVNTQDYQNQYQKYLEQVDGDVEKAHELAAAALGIEKVTGTVPGWFLGNVEYEDRKTKEKVTKARVLLANGEPRTVTGAFEGDRLQPIYITNVNITRNIGAGTESYRLSQESSVSATNHDLEIPLPPIQPLLDAAREQKRGAQTRRNKARGIIGGTVEVNETRGVFIQEGNENWDGAVKIPVVNDGVAVTLQISPTKFEEAFGFDPFEDRDRTKETVAAAGRVLIAGEVDVVANLPDEAIAQYQAELEQVWFNNTGKNSNGKTVLTQPAEVGVFTIQDAYENKNGIAFKVDVDELGYTPTITGETQTRGEYVFGENDDIWFLDIAPGQKVVPMEFQGIGALIQSQLEVKNNPING